MEVVDIDDIRMRLAQPRVGIEMVQWKIPGDRLCNVAEL